MRRSMRGQKKVNSLKERRGDLERIEAGLQGEIRRASEPRALRQAGRVAHLITRVDGGPPVHGEWSGKVRLRRNPETRASG